MSGCRRRPGRLGPFVDGYRVRLLELGHAPLSVTRSLTALGHLGRWMDRHDIDVEQLDDDVLKAFLADHVAEYGRLPSAGVMPPLDYLRDEGVTAYGNAVAHASAPLAQGGSPQRHRRTSAAHLRTQPRAQSSGLGGSRAGPQAPERLA
jgi:hypothetical protein